MNKNDLRVRKTKQNIHKSLLFILKSKPLSHIKITELCKEASINRGTFYFHYEDVGAVFEEIFQEAMLDLQESYEQPYRQGFGEGVTSLDPQTIQIFHHVKKYEDFYKVVLSEDVPMKYFYMLYDELKFLMQRNLQQQHQFFHAYSANAIIGIIIEWYRQNFEQSATDMNKLLVEIVSFRLK